jgi:D-glycero-D-manno-heptose 1,7-bisphosphate phosphatase
VFLDRDGTIIDDVGHLHRLENIHLLPGAARAIRMLNECGLLVVVVTNQSAVARGLLTESALRRVHRTIDVLLRAESARVDAWYYCPHYPGGNVARYSVVCNCRKPSPGMLLRAAKEHHIDLKASWTVGDSASDTAAGKAAGTRVLQIGVDVPSVMEAARLIVDSLAREA